MPSHTDLRNLQTSEVSALAEHLGNTLLPNYLTIEVRGSNANEMLRW